MLRPSSRRVDLHFVSQSAPPPCACVALGVASERRGMSTIVDLPFIGLSHRALRDRVSADGPGVGPQLKYGCARTRSYQLAAKCLGLDFQGLELPRRHCEPGQRSKRGAFTVPPWFQLKPHLTHDLKLTFCSGSSLSVFCQC